MDFEPCDCAKWPNPTAAAWDIINFDDTVLIGRTKLNARSKNSRKSSPRPGMLSSIVGMTTFLCVEILSLNFSICEVKHSKQLGGLACLGINDEHVTLQSCSCVSMVLCVRSPQTLTFLVSGRFRETAKISTGISTKQQHKKKVQYACSEVTVSGRTVVLFSHGFDEQKQKENFSEFKLFCPRKCLLFVGETCGVNKVRGLNRHHALGTCPFLGVKKDPAFDMKNGGEISFLANIFFFTVLILKQR